MWIKLRLKYFKEKMLIPTEEYIINKLVNIRGVDVLLLSFTVEKDKSTLWTINRKGTF